MKKHFLDILLVIVLMVGLGILLYPTVSDYFNSLHQGRAIASYEDNISHSEDTEITAMRIQAQTYNEELISQMNTRFEPTDAEHQRYESLLNVDSGGVMGYIEIPAVNIQLVIYHGTEETNLQSGVGHLEGSSLPVGGESTHCVLTGHRGLPSASLFTNLDQLIEGDIFYLHILGDILAYQVDQIRVVEPEDLSELVIEEGSDYCTLVTCTPYGVNSHRLLVRGHRIDYEESLVLNIKADATQIRSIYVTLFMAIPPFLVMLLILFIRSRRD